MFAAMDGRRLDEAKVLVNAGADLNIQDQVRRCWSDLPSLFSCLQEKGWSAIFFAAEKANEAMAQLLCEAGANLYLQDKVAITLLV